MNLKQNHLEFQKIIEDRGIEYLIHFTPTINLYSILEHSELMSRAKLENLDIDQFDILDFVKFTDEARFDDNSYINLSLSGPNTFLLSKFRQQTSDDITIKWCILKINTKHIYDETTLFSVGNAASKAAIDIGITGDIEKFKMIFAKSIPIPYGVRINTADKFPTNVQAEILVKESIPSESIIAVCFENEKDMAEAKAAMFQFDTSKFVVDKEIYSPRRTQ